LTLAEVEARVRAAVSTGLPGHEAQQLMAPRPRPGWRPVGWPDSARRAAALLLVFPAPGPVLVLTVRSRALLQHAGQVSLPGGAVEPGEALDAAAFREAHEEIGLDPAGARVAGLLTPLHIPVSGFALHPVVAISDTRRSLHPADGEVERILEVPIAELADPARIGRAASVRDGVEYDVPSFDVAGERVWGATAMVLSEFLCVLGVPPDPWGESDH
jgi:8-oxo-dGTP pyrophosphatase MutT (NUDIX family)